MLKALREREEIELVYYVQHDRRWGGQVKIQSIDAKLTIISLPIGLPFERLSFIRQTNRRLQASLLKRLILKQSSLNNLIYWFYDWWNIELISHLPRARTVMELTDLASHFITQDSIVQQEHLRHVKNRANKIVDFFFPVSAALEHECLGAQGKVIVLPNGIGRDFLEQARTPQPEPVELQGIPHPRLCVVSTGWPLNYRLDHDLLMQTLDALPDWQLVLIGCEQVESPSLKKLVQHSRVKPIDLVPLIQLPAYIQNCDVCAAPYPRDVSRAGDSLKVYEYLACGKPVILSSLQGNPRLQGYLRFAFDAKQFTKECQELLHSPIAKSDELDNLLNAMTWEQRVETCLSIISDHELGEFRS